MCLLLKKDLEVSADFKNKQIIMSADYKVSAYYEDHLEVSAVYKNQQGVPNVHFSKTFRKDSTEIIP